MAGQQVIALQRALWEAADRARRFDVSRYEGATRSQLEAAVVPEVLAEADAAVAALEAARNHVLATKAVEASGGAVANVLRMASWELSRLRAWVASLDERVDAEVLLGVVCGLRRRVINVSTVVERALAHHLGLEPIGAELYGNEVRGAVAVRSEYARFQRSLHAHLRGDDPDITAFLRLAATGVAQVLGSDAATHLPMRDRIELRALQQRVIQWMREGVDPRQGRRLVRDVDAFARLLLEINHRPVLVEHDVGRLQRLVDALSTEPLPLEAVAELATHLAGRDAELDDLLDGVTGGEAPAALVQACHREAARVLRRLAPADLTPVAPPPRAA